MKIVLLAIAVLSVVVTDVVHVQGQTPPRTKCTTLDDCAGGEYCSTVDGTCILNGDCTTVEDCTDNFDNIYASTMCIGTMYCIEDAGLPGKCHNICMDTPALCSAYEYCADEDLEANCCPDEEGKFLACCAGIANDDAASDDEDDAAASTSEDAAASDPEDPCIANEDCAAGEYCSTVDGTCLMNGQCASNEDCDNVGNLFTAVMCVGTMYCVEGAAAGLPRTCSKICDGTPKECSAYEACAGLDGACCPDKEGEFLSCCSEEPPPASAECSAFEACAELEGACCPDKEGEFLTCCQGIPNDEEEESPDDGSGGDGGMNPIDPEFAVDSPVDPEFAVDSPVDPDFGVAPPVDPEFGVDPPQGCEADTDCEADKEYCGQGTCISKGMCIVDEDCMNTANAPYADKKCRGYKFCNEFKECDRMCGEPCPGGTGAEETECTVTGCDTKILCPNSVSCTPDYCQDCKGMYFDPLGMVIDGCGVTITDDGADHDSRDHSEDVSASSAAPTSADAPQDGSTTASSPPTSATENDEEKEEKQNDKKDDEEKEEKQNDKKNDEEKEEKDDAAAATTTMTTDTKVADASADTTSTDPSSTDEITVIVPTGTTASADTTIADPSSTGEAIGEGTTYVSGSVSIVGLGRTIGSVAIVVLAAITAVLSL